MASGRILKTQISISEQVNDLSLHAALLFTWMIPHADDFGRMLGSSRRIKAVVVPMRDDFSAKKVEDCLQEIYGKSLILRYVVGGETYIQFPKWEEHQSGLHKRTKSKFPEPPEQEEPIPGNSGNFGEIPSEQNRNRTGTEQNGTGILAPSADALEAVSAEIVIRLPLNDKTEREITRADLDQMTGLYPAVDVMAELSKMRGWCLGNPTKCKTKNGIMKFVHSWLAKAQDKGGTKNAQAIGQGQPGRYVGRNDAAVEEACRINEERLARMREDQSQTLQGEFYAIRH